MKKALKLLSILAIIIVFAGFAGFAGFAQAKPFEKNHLANAIKKAEISNSALIAVSFKELPNGKKAFELNQKTPMIGASVQKIATILPSLDTLGTNYEFTTQLYKSKDNNLYIKLGADPYLSTADLKGLVRAASNCKIASPKSIYIDDSILDSNEWGEGWQWDDDLNPLTPKFGSYNMDNNLLTINISPTTPGAPAEISTEVFYPTAFINNVISGDKTDVKLQRKNYISPDVINADGTVSSDLTMRIPINYPRRYFILRLEDILRKQKIAYYGDYNRQKLPKNNLYMISEIKHPISSATCDILKKSNNMVAETVFKIAGANYAKGTGSAISATEMFNDYYKKLGIDTTSIKIVDGSGVSKNNLITADFITEVLLKASQNKDLDFKSLLASPGEGTLTDRMLYFKDNVKAKTGTLTNVSALAGYIKTKSGKNYAFCIMINDSKSKSADKKAFEEYVLREAFDSL